jgi:hypothetical protein
MGNNAPINVRFKTDLEKLLFAENYISALKDKISSLESDKIELYTDIDEILYECKRFKLTGIVRTINQKEQIRKLNRKIKELKQR